MKKFIVVLMVLFISLLIGETGYSMQWDIINHPENQSIFSWKENHKWVVEEKISRMFIINGNKVDQLHYFKVRDDEGEAAISRRWHLTITDLPESAWWPNRSIQATVYGQEYGLGSVLDGSTFGEISVWEHNPDNVDEINLVIDFTKVRSQNHEFGVHILILHETPKITLINNLVDFQPDPSTFSTENNAIGCPDGYVGKFNFMALLDNTSNKELSNLQIEVNELSNNNVLLTTEGFVRQGERFNIPKRDGFVDGLLGPSESVDVPFIVCLTEIKNFRFFVDVFGSH